MQNEPKSKILLDHLIVQFPTAKRMTLKRMVSEGRVMVDGKRATKLSQPIESARQVRIVGPAKVKDDPRRLIVPLVIVHEDDDLLVVDKPAGLLTSTVPGEKRPTAWALAKRYVAATEPRAVVGLIHRLDREASGLLVFSKNRRAYDSLKTQFFKHTVERVYQAEVRGKVHPTKGTIESRLIERADGTVRSTTEHAKGQRAITEYEVIRQKPREATLLVRLLTGRKHQIRVHLSERGWPIIGDRVYGDAKDSQPLQLRAIRLALEHPQTSNRIVFERLHNFGGGLIDNR